MSKSKSRRNKRGESRPTAFSDIGKRARDVLTSGYSYNQQLSISSYSHNGMALTSSVVENQGLSTSTVAAQYKYKYANTIINVQVSKSSNISATLSLRDILPSTNTIASFKLPDYKHSELKVQYFHEHTVITTSIGLNLSPEFEISTTIGTPTITFGVEVKYKTACNVFTKYNAGISMTKPDYDASIILANKGDLLRASYVHYLNKKRISAVAEITRRFSTSENTYTIGGSWIVDYLTMVKTRLDNHGKLRTFLQHQIRPKSYLTISSQVDTMALDKIPKIGLALALKI